MTTIRIAEQFSAMLGGRFRKDFDYSAEEFYEKLLRPLLSAGDQVTLDFRDFDDIPSSFADEIFKRTFIEFGEPKLSDMVLLSIDGSDVESDLDEARQRVIRLEGGGN